MEWLTFLLGLFAREVCLTLFAVFFVFRYFRTIVSIFAYNKYKPKPVLDNPKYTPDNVSVIIPTTYGKPEELVRCVRGILQAGPKHVLIVTAENSVKSLRDTMAINLSASNIVVLGVERLNKREQILKALKHIETEITVLADDDVFWPDNYLSYLLAIFEDDKVGAGGTRQRVKRNDKPDFWNFLGISYLERRVWNNCATNAIDGSLSTLSGRTAAYRTRILQNPQFEYYFTHDTWRGKPLNSDDDKCLTRYVYSNGWKIVLQFDPRAIIETTVEGDRKYLDQCMRWARAHWRGNWTVIENETYWRSLKYWWGCYYIYIGSFQTPALAWDGILFGLLSWGVSDKSAFVVRSACISFGAWIFFTKILKLIPHFRRHPSDMKFIPVSIAFSYFHGYLNLRAAFTMKTTHWGGKDLATAEKAKPDNSETVPLLKKTMADGVSSTVIKRKST